MSGRPLSVLDVSPVSSGSVASEALRNTIDLAQLADRLGYHRYWLAEHHNSSSIASSAPEVMIGYVASATATIRVGSGGMMLPNHSPLHVAEQFRVLEAMHPGRIDLGIGRAPGTDTLTALALRGSEEALSARDFPERLQELLGFLGDGFPDDHPFRLIDPVPQDVAGPPVWLLGSSDFSALLAARLGLGFAFARHIGPGGEVAALRAYREEFRPSPRLAEPATILAAAVFVGEDEREAQELASSGDLAWLRIVRGEHEPLPSPAEAMAYDYSPTERELVEANRRRFLVGDAEVVRSRLEALADEARAEELMLLTMVHGHAARRRSHELLARAFELEPRGAEATTTTTRAA